MKKSYILLLLMLVLMRWGLSAQPYPSTSYELRDGYRLMRWLGTEERIDMTKDPVLRNIREVYSDAFDGNNHIREIVLPKSVEELSFTFQRCSRLERVLCEDGGEELAVRDYAFMKCPELKEVVFPRHVQLNGNPFDRCPKAKVSFTGRHNDYFIRDNVIYERATKTLIFAAPVASGHIDIWSEAVAIQGAQGDGAFSGSSVESVLIPESIEEIPESAFSRTERLRVVALPRSLKRIGRSAFYRSAVSTIIFPEGLTTIGDGAFARSINLPEVMRLPASLSDLHGSAFGASSVRRYEVHPNNPYYVVKDGSVFSTDGGTLVAPAINGTDTFTIPADVRVLGKGGFAMSTYRSIVFAGVVDELQEAAFNWMPNLEALVLPEGLRIIGDRVGNTCEKLRVIDLPSTLEQIEGSAFIKFSNLYRQVICRAVTPPRTDRLHSLWQNVNSKYGVDTLYVPRASIDIYKITPAWRSFKVIKAVEDLPKPTFAVHLQEAEGGGVAIKGRNASALTAVERGTELEVEVSVKPGFRLTSLSVNGVDITDSRRFVVQRESRVEAVFEAQMYYVSLDAGYGGRIRIKGNPSLDNVRYGTEMEVLVEPEEGYVLERLTAGDRDITAGRRFVVQTDTDVRATFKTQEFTLTLHQAEGGRIDVWGHEEQLTVPYGTEVDVNVYNDAGYELEALTANARDIKGNHRIVVKENMDIRVSFRQLTYPVKIEHNAGGRIVVSRQTPETLAAVPYGRELEIEVIPDLGYELISLKANDESIISNLSFSVYGATTIRGVFAKKTYALSHRVEGNGTVRFSGASDLGAIPYGTEVDVEAIPDEGYELVSLLANGVDILSAKRITVVDYIDVVAVFSQKTSVLSPEDEKSQIRIYPLPARDYLRVEGLAPDAPVSLVDMQGRVVLCRRLCDSRLAVQDLPRGQYILVTSDASYPILLE